MTGLSLVKTALLAAALGCAACTHAPAAYGLASSRELALAGFPSPLLQATLDGRPALFLVDTGAAVHTLARWFASTASLPSEPGDVARDSTGREVHYDRVHALLVAQGRAAPIELIVVDFPSVFQEHGIAGLLSPQQLAAQGEAAVLDERAGTLRFASFQEAVRETGAEELPGARVCSGSKPQNRLYVAPVLIGANTAMLELDTGATSTVLAASSPAAASLPAKEGTHSMGVGGRALSTPRADAEIAFAGRSSPASVQLMQRAISDCEGEGLLGQDVLAACVLVLGDTQLAARCAP